MSGRFKAIPEKTKNISLVYVVIDTLTGEWMHVYDCFMWAEHKADEMNRKEKKGDECQDLTNK
jgi:hypothetical protein